MSMLQTRAGEVLNSVTGETSSGEVHLCTLAKVNSSLAAVVAGCNRAFSLAFEEK